MSIRFHHQYVLIWLAGIALSGCGSATDPVRQPTSEPEDCNAAAFTYLKWQPESHLETVKLPVDTRVIGPGMVVTADYRANRLNITIGKLGRIERIYCG